MARKTAKKQAEAPKVDIGAEIFASLRELEKLKGIPVDYMVERLKQALTNAYRKDREDRRDVPADNVVVDLSEHGLSMHIVKTAVEEVEDTALEIPIDAARNYNPDVQVGDPVNIPVDIQKFGRIAAQTAKQVVIQGIREAERGVAYESYDGKSGNYEEKIDGNTTETVGKNATHKIGGDLKFIVGGSTVTLTQGGTIKIEGTDVEIKGSTVNISGGSGDCKINGISLVNHLHGHDGGATAGPYTVAGVTGKPQ